MNKAISPAAPDLQNYRTGKVTRATPRVSNLVTPPLYRTLHDKQLKNQTHHHGNFWGVKRSAAFGEPLGAPPLPKKRVCKIPTAILDFPERLVLPYPDEEMLSGYEEDVSSIRDGLSALVKSDFVTTLRRHTVDVKSVNAAFRKTPLRTHSTSCRGYHFNNEMPNRLTEQKRLSVCSWNPGPRRGKGAIEKQIAVKWHIITLQEAIEYLEHEFLTIRFHVTHCGGCAILFSKDTLHPDIKVTSAYLHRQCSNVRTAGRQQDPQCCTRVFPSVNLMQMPSRNAQAHSESKAMRSWSVLFAKFSTVRVRLVLDVRTQSRHSRVPAGSTEATSTRRPSMS